MLPRLAHLFCDSWKLTDESPGCPASALRGQDPGMTSRGPPPPLQVSLPLTARLSLSTQRQRGSRPHARGRLCSRRLRALLRRAPQTRCTQFLTQPEGPLLPPAAPPARAPCLIHCQPEHTPSSCICSRPGNLSAFSSALLPAFSAFLNLGDFPGGLVDKTRLPMQGEWGAGSIPGQGTKIPHALQPKYQNVKQEQSCNKFNKSFKNGPH